MPFKLSTFAASKSLRFSGELKPSTKYYVATPLWSVPLSNFNMYKNIHLAGSVCSVHATKSCQKGRQAGQERRASPALWRRRCCQGAVPELGQHGRLSAPTPRLRYLARTFSVLTSVRAGGGGLAVRPAKASWPCPAASSGATRPWPCPRLHKAGQPMPAPPGAALHVSTQGNVFTFMDLSANLYILGGMYNKRKIKKC